MNLALVTPLNGRASGVADYSLDLLPYLARAAGSRITVFSDGKGPKTEPDGDWLWRPITELPQVAPEIDLFIYQMGNSPAHDFMASSLLRYPGLVVLHDLSLHSFYARQAVHSDRLAPYLRAFGFSYGTRGLSVARDHLRRGVAVGYPDYLLCEWLAASSLGVIVHSEYAATLLGERCPLARIWTIPMPIPLPQRVTVERARAQLNLAPDLYLVVVFGIINPSKNPQVILDAARSLRMAGIPIKAVFIGQESASFELSLEVEQRGLHDAVVHLGFVDGLKTVNLWLSAADVAIALRSTYWGETPSSALRMLAGGLPLITHSVGAFAELPDAACIKLASTNSLLSEALSDALADLYRQPGRRQAMGLAARQYITDKHDPNTVATHYVTAAHTILGPGNLPMNTLVSPHRGRSRCW